MAMHKTDSLSVYQLRNERNVDLLQTQSRTRPQLIRGRIVNKAPGASRTCTYISLGCANEGKSVDRVGRRKKARADDGLTSGDIFGAKATKMPMAPMSNRIPTKEGIRSDVRQSDQGTSISAE
jgi:hypothetical protein